MQKVYFPGLNALRFYAAFCVVIFHLNIVPNQWFGEPVRHGWYDFLLFDGWDSVTFFFVLSGFLITYLLLEERRYKGGIDIRGFYARRALRIWPLYYLIVGLGFVVLPLIIGSIYLWPADGQPLALTFVLVMLPNIPYVYTQSMRVIAHLWSVGVEEQFYLIWPILVKRIRYLPLALMVVIAFKWCLLLIVMQTYDQTQEKIWREVEQFLLLWRLESMAIGGFGAYFLFYKHSILKVIYHPVVEKLLIVLMIFIIILPISGDPIFDFTDSIIFIGFILNVATNPHSTLKLENKIFHALGNVSYGIYMYHTSVIYLVLFVFHRLDIVDIPLYPVILYSTSVGLTLIVSFVSHHYFEKPFLRLKNRYSIWSHQPVDIPGQQPIL